MTYTAEYFIEKLQMEAHYEGGYYKFVHKNDLEIPKNLLPSSYEGSRRGYSLIYYLLKPGQTSCWHKLLSEEAWLWHYGGTLSMTLGTGDDNPIPEKMLLLGPDLENNEQFQIIVPAGYWQTTKPAGDTFALVSCVVSPGFEKEDFFLPSKKGLV